MSAASHLTLHYRISMADPPHAEVLSTFGGRPATLVLGTGELAPALERCLAGIESSGRHTFMLAAGEAFGRHRDELVRRVPAQDLPGTRAIEPGQVVELEGPHGARLAGRVKEIEGGEALVDFNHPLAGRPIRFEVEILAVL